MKPSVKNKYSKKLTTIQKILSKIEINMAIQINGKTRQVIKTDQNRTEEQIRDIALKDPKIEKYLDAF